jgi:hypothetical protein
MAAANRAERRAQRKWKVEEFREQAFEAKGALSHIELEVGGETFIIPNPQALDDETQARVESFQRGDGLDRVTLLDDDGTPLKGVTGEEVTRIKEPHAIDGVVLEPVGVRSARAILGDEVHARFIEKGGRSSDITGAWEYMVREIKERAESDPK